MSKRKSKRLHQPPKTAFSGSANFSQTETVKSHAIADLNSNAAILHQEKSKTEDSKTTKFFDNLKKNFSVSVAVSLFSVLIAFMALKATIENNRTQQRAYVGLEKTELVLSEVEVVNLLRVQPGDIIPNNIILSFQNHGATPARNAEAWLSWQTAPFGHSLPESFTFDDKTPNLPKNIVMNRSKQVIFPHSFWKTRVAVLNPKPFFEARNNNKSLYLYGHIDYDDIFGEKHRTQFCYVYDHHNKIDSFEPYSKNNECN